MKLARFPPTNTNGNGEKLEEKFIAISETLSDDTNGCWIAVAAGGVGVGEKQTEIVEDFLCFVQRKKELRKENGKATH